MIGAGDEAATTFLTSPKHDDDILSRNQTITVQVLCDWFREFQNLSYAFSLCKIDLMTLDNAEGGCLFIMRVCDNVQRLSLWYFQIE